MEQEEKQMEVAFNLSSLQIGEVFRLLQLADNCYLSGDYIGMVKCLGCAKLSVIQSLTQTERKQLLKDEKEMNFHLSYARKYGDDWKRLNYGERELKTADYFQRKFKGSLKSKAEQYKTRLMDFLEVHGYLIKKMQDYTTMFA